VTEQEWLACTDRQMMLDFLRGGGASGRKLRLFAVACCRRIFPLMPDSRSRQAVTTCELYADGLTSQRDLVAARAAAGAAVREWEVAPWSVERGKVVAAARAARDAARPTDQPAALGNDMRQAAEAAFTADVIGRLARRMHVECVLPQCHLLRDIFNPFLRVTLSPACRTAQVVALAQAAYEQRELPSGALDTARLAVLADALEEAGCTDADILGHLRGPGPHVRGCWVLDLLLGKE
jgi:hypothetical protein